MLHCQRSWRIGVYIHVSMSLACKSFMESALSSREVGDV